MSREFVKDLVSVITPVYNAERFIQQTLESMIAQTYERIEFILVDDCSSDSSAQIIKSYEKKHTNIIYHLQEKNMGAGVARNKALEIAKGQYVAFLDSDDLWAPEKTKRQIDLMKSTGTPLCYAAIEMIDEQGKNIKGKRSIPEECDYNLLLHNTLIATSSVIVDRIQLGDFRMPIRRGGQDYATWLMLLRGGVVAKGINEVLVRYRISKGSLSSNKFKSIKQVWDIQTQDEQISYPIAMFNVLLFVINGLKKYFM